MSRRWLRRFAWCVSVLLSTGGVAAAQGIPLEGIVVTSTKTPESAIDALSGSSVITKQQLDEQFQADRPSQFLRTIPGVTTAESARDTAQSVNIRGLQDFGRVNVLIDGARQNFQRSGHIANGVFYIEPEMLKSVDITRGPTSVIYGSGAIGGVAAFNRARCRRHPARQREGGLAQPHALRLERRRHARQRDRRHEARQLRYSGPAQLALHRQLRGRRGRQGSGFRARTTSRRLVKSRWRPAPGHQITGTIIDFNSEFVDRPTATSSTRRDSDVHNQQYILGYTFARPDVPLARFQRQDLSEQHARCIRRFWPPGWSPSVPSAASMSRRKASTSATPRASSSAT